MKKTVIFSSIIFVYLFIFNIPCYGAEKDQNYMTQSMTLMGTIKSVNEQNMSFIFECRSKKQFEIFTGNNTVFDVIKNLDYLEQEEKCDIANDPEKMVKDFHKYIKPGKLFLIQGIYQETSGKNRFDARYVYLPSNKEDKYDFEEDGKWWLTQISYLGNEWLQDLFGDKRSYKSDDFAQSYRTNLNILGKETDEPIQECATLSRLIYGLSSAYLMTGNERYYMAAKAGVEYERQTFRIVMHDGKHCLWAHGFKKLKNGGKLIVTSQIKDDINSLPLYEQIYALAGLSQYYRITSDPQVLNDIMQTVNSFNDYYRDNKLGGYFSHIDYPDLRPDAEILGKNKSRKNWNSIGDHIPAYLINLILAIDPLPQGRDDLKKFRDDCIDMLEDTSKTIIEKFPDRNKDIPYFNERFFADWTVDNTWGWQSNRAIIGHNLKIAWNLTRCANYFLYLDKQTGNKKYKELSDKFFKISQKVGHDMANLGIDQIHGGLFDIVERVPSNCMPLEFPWSNTKEFWQQEQGILAYLILHGIDNKDSEFLQLARELSIFWNVFFLDHDNNGVFFRVNDNGLPVINGLYGNKAWHAISGYHAFELNYLAHIYTRAYVIKNEKGYNHFCIYFKPDKNSGQKSINVLPDFFKPGDVEIVNVTVNGIKKTNFKKDNFQLQLDDKEAGAKIMVEFKACKGK